MRQILKKMNNWLLTTDIDVIGAYIYGSVMLFLTVLVYVLALIFAD